MPAPSAGGRDVQGQDMTQRIDGQMKLRALLSGVDRRARTYYYDILRTESEDLIRLTLCVIAITVTEDDMSLILLIISSSVFESSAELASSSKSISGFE